MKHYCSSQAQNSIPDDYIKKIKVKFNKSTFCKPGLMAKKKREMTKTDVYAKRNPVKTSIQGQNYYNSETSNGPFSSKKFVKERKSGKFFSKNQQSIKSSNPFSGKTSYSNSKKNIFSTEKGTKSIKEMGNLKMESANDSTYQRENYFSITSDEKNKQFTVLPSALSLGTETSLYSQPPKENEEFNLYCVDESHPANTSGSQIDIIYNKKRQQKRKGVQTMDRCQPKFSCPSKMTMGTKPKTRSIRGILKKSKQKRLKKFSFQNKANN